MTDLEILKQAYETLDNLNVPVSLTEQIAIPVANTSNRLKALYKAVVEAIENKKEEIPPEAPVTDPEPEPQEEN